jgi:hypothetical protein
MSVLSETKPKRVFLTLFALGFISWRLSVYQHRMFVVVATNIRILKYFSSREAV